MDNNICIKQCTIKSDTVKLLDLPEEILIFIVKNLDFNTKFNLYQTCTFLQKIMCLNGVITTCILSLNTLATSQTLKHGIISDVSNHLEELNLCALPDLSKSALLPIARKLKHLKTLDVSYTSIVIPDLIDIHKACPTIKNISIHFSFGKLQSSNAILCKCQHLFSNFENVHFVGNPYLIYSEIPNYILAKSPSLVKVKYTVIRCEQSLCARNSICQYMKEINHAQWIQKYKYQFHELFLFLLDWRKCNENFGYLNDMSFVNYLDCSNFEYFIIKREKVFGNSHVYVSPIFRGLFTKNFNNTTETEIDVVNQDNIKITVLQANVVIMIWDKSTNKFDELFFSKVLEKIKDFFPYHYEYESSLNEDNVHIKDNEWSLLTVSNLKPLEHSHEKENHLLTKKKRKAPTTYILSYDDMFKDRNKIKLSINFQAIFSPVTLSSADEYLKKITFLSLTGLTVFESTFFQVLFKYCKALVTLNIELSCSSLVGKSIHLSTSLRNFRLEEKSINYNVLIKGLSECPLLENIHLVDQSRLNTDLSNLSEILEKNYLLYNLFVQAPMADSVRLKVLRKLNEVKNRYQRHYMNIELYKDFNGNSYGPFIDVFNLNPLKYI